MIKFRFLRLISLLFFLSFQKLAAQNRQDLQLVKEGIQVLNDVMMHDITSPPVASRNYMYVMVAFYEAVSPSNQKFLSYAGQLNGLEPLPKIADNDKYDWLLAGMMAFYKTAYAFVFSKDQFRQSWKSIELKLLKRKNLADIRTRSIQYGEQVSQHIIQWGKGDGFVKTRAMPRFTTSQQSGVWQQTGPDFMEAVEPYWNTIRTITISKPNEFLLPRPATFNSEKFLAECKEVYETGLKLTPEQIAIANFWDCNPYATRTIGHLMYSIKKISPAGHWIGITGVAIKHKKQNLAEAAFAYSLVSIAMFDAIIAAWDEKFRSNYIRPVTAIQQLISPTWQPVLQTPPFPEYPSGHSVISNAAATILTFLFGDNFHYIDDVEKPYGLPSRSFNSFYEAADEAAISRLYGGIHFREAIENGKEMGKKAGNAVINKVGLKPVNK